jgi:hypothetical protein
MRILHRPRRVLYFTRAHRNRSCTPCLSLVVSHGNSTLQQDSLCHKRPVSHHVVRASPPRHGRMGIRQNICDTCMQPIGADKFCSWRFAGNVTFPTAQKRQQARCLRSWLTMRCADQEQFLFLGSFRRMTQGGETVPPSPIHPANPPTIYCTSAREQPSHSSASSSRSSSSSSDEEHASDVGGLPDIILIGLVAAMDAARKHT